MKRTALIRKTPLRAKKSLVGNSTLRKVSKKQAVENKEWAKIKAERIELLITRFEYLPCECCHEAITETPDAHHNNRNRRNNTLRNARILKHDHHMTVHDHNVMDVPSLLGLLGE